MRNPTRRQTHEVIQTIKLKAEEARKMDPEGTIPLPKVIRIRKSDGTIQACTLRQHIDSAINPETAIESEEVTW